MSERGAPSSRGGLVQQVPSGQIEIDDRFLKEWLAYGFKALAAYLTRHAEFDEYLKLHPPRE